jgi:hypothetical protein
MAGKKVGLVELVTAIGDDALLFQALDEVATDYNLKRGKRGKRGESDLTEIRFLTDAITPTQIMQNDLDRRLGLVVWLPRKRVAEILKLAKETP